jgi:hypothetical protein
MIILKAIQKILLPQCQEIFFRYSLIRQFCSRKSLYGINNKVLDYVEKSFNRSRSALLSSDFDLELLFSFIEAQINDAKSKSDEIQLNYLEEVRLNLIIAIGDTFFDLEWRMPVEGRDLLEKFGEIIYQTKSDVITFNYDCLVEWAIEQASGESGLRNEGAPFFNWDRYSAYGIKFTKIRSRRGYSYYDSAHGRNIAKKFYEKYYNNSPDARFIKLHGSYNWYKYSNFKYNKEQEYDNLRKITSLEKIYVKGRKIPLSLEKELLSFNGDWQFGILPVWGYSRYPNVLEPLIIPPILIKEQELRKNIFQQLWSMAKESLLKCEEVIFIGYSFPDTDFYSKKLFIEVFSQNKDIKVAIVNPDSLVENKFRELVNFGGMIKRYASSGEFINKFT